MTLFCEICNVDIPSEVVMKSHVQGKRHCRLFKEQKKRREETECSVFVRGFPPGTTDKQLQMIFSRYGPVTNVFLETKRDQFAFVRFQSSATVSTLLTPHFGPLYIGNYRLSVRPRQRRPVVSSTKCAASPATSSDDTTKTSRSELLPLLGKCTDVEQQMVTLQKEIELSCEEVQQRGHIQQQLQELFQTQIPNCQVFLFGSSVSGVGMHACDMDIFLDVATDGGTQQNDHSENKCSAILSSISKLLRRFNAVNNVLVIKSTRCPLVKFDHIQSGLKCDLSVKNRLALQNTRLIRLLCDVDPRVQTLIYNVRYWAKVKQLAGNPSGGQRLTSYALTMMVVFYLRQLDVPLLPSIEQLAKLAVDAGDACDIDGWDCSFHTDLDKLQSVAAANADNLSDLLAGFFRFYATFDLGSYVLCIRPGSTVDIAAFSSRMKEDERLAQFKISPICVQDPFVLNHNVTSNANERVRVRFMAEAQAAASLFSVLDFSVPSSNHPWGIAALLADGPLVDDTVPTAPPSRQHSTHSFTIAMESSKLPVSYVQKYGNVIELKDGWSRDLSTLIRKLLKDVLYIQCVEGNEKTSQSNANGCHLSGKKRLVEMCASLKCHDNASKTIRCTGNDSAQTTGTGGERQRVNECAQTSSSLQKTEASVSELPTQSSSGELKKPKETLHVRRDDVEPVEADLDGDVSDGVDIECPVGKRPSSDNLMESNISKRSRSEDKLPQSDQVKPLTVASGTPPATSSMAAGGADDCPAADSGTSCTDMVQGSGKESSQAITASLETANSDTTVGHAEMAETAEAIGSPAASSPLSMDGTGPRKGDGISQDRLLCCLQCTSRIAVWSGRKKLHNTLKRLSLTGLEAEIKLSEILASKLGEHNAACDFGFRLTLTLVNSRGQTMLVVDTQPTSGAKIFSCFFLFFKRFVSKHVQLAFK